MGKAFGNIDATLTRAPGNNGFVIQGSYDDIDPSTGNPIPSNIYLPMPYATATAARDTLNSVTNTLVDRHHNKLTSYNVKNGIKAQ